MKKLILSSLALSITALLALSALGNDDSKVPQEQILAKCKCKEGGNKGKS